jgi:type IV secretory pathway protease TraF
MRDPEAPSQDGASPRPGHGATATGIASPRRVVRGATRAGRGVRGVWRVTVSEGSMAPAVLPGDWLLVDPTVRRWPRRGSIVVFREPFTDVLAIKRVAARPGDWVPFADGWLQLADDEAWLLGDADDAAVAAAGHGAANDSRRFGPVPVESLVGRAWLRYGPWRRAGRLAPAPADLLDRGRTPR